MTVQPENILVLGIGNVLWADEGFGVRALEALSQRYEMPEHVLLVDGGTQGLSLLPLVEAAHRMIVLDAIDFGLSPGALHKIEADQVPAYLQARKMSLHQTGFSEVLGLAQLKGNYPLEVVVIGVQPVQLDDFGGSLSPAVKQCIDQAVELTCQVLQRWSIDPQPRKHEAPSVFGSSALELERYESERPSESQAWRKGDARFVNCDTNG